MANPNSNLNVPGVYWYVCLPTQVRYIGSSVNIRNRNKQHEGALRAGTNSRYFQNAWDKYGADSFFFEVVEEVPLPPYDPKRGLSLKDFKALVWRPILQSREQYYLDLWKDKYNLCPIAYSRLGSSQPPEAVEKVRAFMKAYMAQPEIAEKYRQLRLGKTWDDVFGHEKAGQMKSSVSKNRTGQRLGVSPPNKGVPLSEEHNALLQAARAAYYAEHNVWNDGLTWEEAFGPEVAIERKAMYAKLANDWFTSDDNRELHAEAMRKGTQERVEREGKHWKEGTVQSIASRRAISEAKGASLYMFEGEQRPVSEIARMVGLERATLRKRLARGEPIEQATRQELSKGGSKLGQKFTDDRRANISEALKTSDKAAAYHESRKGVSSKPPKSGYFAILRLDNGRFKVRLAGEPTATFKTLPEAIAHRDAILANKKD